MKNHHWPLLSVAMLGLALAACRQSPPAAPPAPEGTTQTTPDAATPAAAPAESAATPGAAAPLPPRSLSPAGATVAILSPRNGDVVSSPVKVVFDLQGMTLAPAGDPTPNSGHHHLLVDVPAPDLGQPIPKDEQHLHFGKAQTEAEITLTPGQHTLQLLLGDSNHVPHNPPVMSTPITITVQ
jgi:hypothetical protein